MKKLLAQKVKICILIAFLVIGMVLLVWNIQSKNNDYENKLNESLQLIRTSSLDAGDLALTYQKVWNASIKNDITFEALGNALGVEEHVVEGMVKEENKALFMHGKKGINKGDFNTGLSIVTMVKIEDAASILEQRSEINEMIKPLKKPKKNHEDHYNDLLDVYEVYDMFVNLSTVPKGSYIEFSENINSTFENLNSKINALELKY